MNPLWAAWYGGQRSKPEKSKSMSLGSHELYKYLYTDKILAKEKMHVHCCTKVLGALIFVQMLLYMFILLLLHY